MTSAAMRFDPELFETVRRDVARLKSESTEARREILVAREETQLVRDFVATHLDDHTAAIRALGTSVDNLAASSDELSTRVEHLATASGELASRFEGMTAAAKSREDALWRSIASMDQSLATRTAEDQARAKWVEKQNEQMRQDAQRAVAEVMLQAMSAGSDASAAHAKVAALAPVVQKVDAKVEQVDDRVDDVKVQTDSLAQKIDKRLGLVAIVVLVLERALPHLIDLINK